MRRRTVVIAASLLALVASAAHTLAASAAAAPYVVIAHASNPATSIDRVFVEDVFMKRVTRWPGGLVAQPADLPLASPARRAFSEQVLGRPVSAVHAHWLQRIFSGRDVPPPTVADDAEMVRFVAGRAGAIGYVTPGAALEGVRSLQVR